MENISKLSADKAMEIAKELDKKDGKEDNKISVNVWKTYAVPKFTATDNVEISISVAKAKQSIWLYMKREADKTGENRSDIAEKWFNDVQAWDPNAPKKENGVSEVTIDGGAVNEVVVTSSSKAKRLTVQNTEVPILEAPAIDLQEIPVSTYVAKTEIPDIQIENDVEPGNEEQLLAEAEKAEAAQKEELRQNVEGLVKQEIAKRKLKESDVDVPYWVDRITRVSSDFGIPYEIIVSIISKENCFTKNIQSVYGQGAMAITGIAIRDFFPTGQGNWNSIYQQVDSELLNDILYKKDEDGNLLKDANGNPILKYKSVQEMRTACGKDDELSMKIGSLVFEMKYAQAVAAKKFGRVNCETVKKAIEMLKSGEIKLSENDNIACVSQAVKNYNGCDKVVYRRGKPVVIKEDYRRDVMDSLKVQGFNFAEQNIIKRT